MQRLPDRIIVTDKGRSKSIPQWGIVQDTPVQIVGKVLVLCVDDKGQPLDIEPNPRWLPCDMLDS